MDKAKELLLGDTAKVYEIANAVGYPDAHYFAKVFKAALGRTPQEYRNHQ